MDAMLTLILIIFAIGIGTKVLKNYTHYTRAGDYVHRQRVVKRADKTSIGAVPIGVALTLIAFALNKPALGVITALVAIVPIVFSVLLRKDKRFDEDAERALIRQRELTAATAKGVGTVAAGTAAAVGVTVAGAPVAVAAGTVAGASLVGHSVGKAIKAKNKEDVQQMNSQFTYDASKVETASDEAADHFVSIAQGIQMNWDNPADYVKALEDVLPKELVASTEGFPIDKKLEAYCGDRYIEVAKPTEVKTQSSDDWD